MSNYCYYCGRSPAVRPVQISLTFTAAGMIKASHSDVMCDRCYGIMFGDMQRVWYHNVDEGRHVPLFLRGLHQLWQGEALLKPALLPPEEHAPVSAAGKAGKPMKLQALTHIPKRIEVRDWLLNPPEPPFTIAIAESGQKHILFLAQEGFDRDNFPVQFEMDCMQINRGNLTEAIELYEKLLALGFSKTEIDSGNYRPDRILANFEQWQTIDKKVSLLRSGGKPSRLLQLISFVAQRPEVFVNTQSTDLLLPKVEKIKEVKLNGQLALF